MTVDKIIELGDFAIPMGVLPKHMTDLLDSIVELWDKRQQSGKSDWDRESVLEALVWTQGEIDGLVISD